MGVATLRTLAVCLTVTAALAGVAAAKEQGPSEWPSKFVMYQESYFPTVNNSKQEGFMYYNYDDLMQRVDHTLIRGSIPSVSLNMSEFWIRDNFYIIDWVKSSCIPIPIGFGMPRPDWFLTNVTNIGNLYLMHEKATTLTNCTWLLHDAPINPFNYYYNSATGEPYRLQAPSGGPLQGQEVVNNWYNQTRVTSFPQDKFKLPSFCPPVRKSSATASVNDKTRSGESLIWNPLVRIAKYL